MTDQRLDRRFLLTDSLVCLVTGRRRQQTAHIVVSRHDRPRLCATLPRPHITVTLIKI